MLYGVKYTKERLEELGITVSHSHAEDTWRPSLIVEGSDGRFMRYPPTIMIELMDTNLIDAAIDRFIVQLRKEKLQKLNEIQIKLR